jgi:acetolactate synthase I/II/III large subunit
MRVADYIVARLFDEGAKHIFMVTGRGILFLSDAVAKHEKIKSISVHHEQAGSFAAMAYAQYNEKFGACLVSTGCAGTNTITGLLCAWQDSVPCIFISGQNKLKETTRYSQIPIRTFGQQEADIIKIVEPLTKYATMITNPQKVAYEMDKAVHLANYGRKGPVWIDVPLDIQNMRVEPDNLERFIPEKNTLYLPKKEDIIFLKDAIEQSERPAILIGSGIRAAGALDSLDLFVEKYKIPVTFANSAPDIYGRDKRLSMGMVGSLGGTRVGNFTLQNSDLLIILGCRLSPITTGPDYKSFARAAKKIVVDIDEVEHSKNTVTIDHLIIADVKKVLDELINEKNVNPHEEWLAKCEHWKKIFPLCEDRYKESEKVDLHFLAENLTHVLPPDAVLLCDAGFEELIIPSTVSFIDGQRCLHPVSQGSMGYALPGAIGAYFASGNPTIAVIGDGSIMMNLQEFQTIKYYNIPIKIIVVNNNVYSVIRNRQTELFRSRTIGTDPSNGVGCPKFQKVAECFEIAYVCINDSLELNSKLISIFNMDGPVLCEILAIEDQEYLRSAYGHNSKRQIVQRPIEDQAPFMDRDLLCAEMIIKPLD